MDVALHRCGVTFVLDRAGRHRRRRGLATTACGTCPILQVVPGLRLAAPRDAARLRELLREAVAGRRRPDRRTLPEGPAERRPRGRRPGRRLRRAGPQRHQGRADRRRRLDGRAVASRWPSGWWRRASASPSSTRAGSSRSTRPWSTWPATHRLVVSVEDNGIVGGCGVGAAADPQRGAASTTPVRLHGIPQEFLDHAKRGVILERIGLTAQTLARSIVEDVTALDQGDPGRRGVTRTVRG